MKKILAVVLTLSTVTFFNCGGDDEDFLTPLVGAWDVFSISITGCDDESSNGTQTCEDADMAAIPCTTITIDSDGTYTLVDNTNGGSESGDVTVTASKITLCATGDPNCTGDDYTLSGNALTVSFTEDDSPGCLFEAKATKRS